MKIHLYTRYSKGREINRQSADGEIYTFVEFLIIILASIVSAEKNSFTEFCDKK